MMNHHGRHHRRGEPRAARPAPRVSLATAVTLGALCGAAGWQLGEQRGAERAAALAAMTPQDPLERMDQVAQWRRPTAPSADAEPAHAPVKPPGVATAEGYSFHQALRGLPRRGADTPPPPPPPKVAAPAPQATPHAGKPVVAEAPVKPAARPELAHAPAIGELTLQTEPLAAKQDALGVYEALSARGWRATIVPQDQGGSTVYRVRVGRFVDRRDAEAGARSLQELAQVQSSVVRN